MIESITLSDVATYDATTPEQLNDLSLFNFVFGSNGSGKTTISRVVADEAKFPTCKVIWKRGTKLQPFVYNHDFVERNFNQSAELKGVFTLGEKQLDTLAKINATKDELDKLTDKIERLTQALQGEDGNGGKKGELATLEEKLKEKCWAQKNKYDAKLQGGFEGYRSSMEKFRRKVLQEQVSNTAVLLTLPELEKKSESVFGLSPASEASVPAIDTSKILAHEIDPILKKRVIGKDDVDIAAMIKKLSNSDWVQEGRKFYDVNAGVCPFCQRKTTDAFAESLKEYFDESFITDSKAIADLAMNYATDAVSIQKQLAEIIATSSRFIDVERLKVEKEVFNAKIALNSQRLGEKKKEASQTVELESLSSVCTGICTLIDKANNQVTAHNKMVENLADERATLTAQVWKFVLEELKTDLAEFKVAKDDLDKAISAMTSQMEKATEDKRKKTSELRTLEKQATSVQPTINGINDLLRRFGFQGFTLEKAASGTSYKLVRADSTDAKETLSEGEKTFVTFLYFYHLLKGSDSDSGMTTDRIVVFDDPVSSLDSDILFIISSLIRGLFDEVRAGIV